MKNKFYLVVIFASVFCCSKLNAQTVIAQSTTSYGSYDWGNYYDPDYDMTIDRSYGQTFKSSVNATISEIQFYIYNVYSSGSFDIEIYSCSSPTSWGTLLNTKTNISLSTTGWFSVDVSALNVSVIAGNYYGFKLIPHYGFYAGLGADNDVYPDGHSWTSYDDFSEATDIAFKAISNTTLPVQLIYFTAQKQNEQVLLQWSTANEQNSKNFIVERSLDGNNWNNIGIVAASGNSNSPINYSYSDSHPALGMNYYRLLQMDQDGKSSYSQVRVVKISNDGQVISLITNPVVDGELKMQINKATMLSLYDASGRLIWKKRVNPGLQNISIRNYTAGIYFLKAGTTTEKILVQ
jgi:hypothetical protein